MIAARNGFIYGAAVSVGLAFGAAFLVGPATFGWLLVVAAVSVVVAERLDYLHTARVERRELDEHFETAVREEPETLSDLRAVWPFGAGAPE